MLNAHCVTTTRHPNMGTKPSAQRHGPFDTETEARAYAKRLRKSGGWGRVKVVPANRQDGRAPRALRGFFSGF